MPQDYDALVEAMQRYFDGLYRGDTALLRGVFHPQARYVCATAEPLIDLGLEDYFAIVAEREPPAARSEKRRDEIVSIAFAGPRAALVRAHCAIGPRFFTDLLSFVRTDAGWRIIAKVFHYELDDKTSRT